MIARHRGEHHTHGLWHPRRDTNPKPPPTSTDCTELARPAAATAATQPIADAHDDTAAARPTYRRRTHTRLLLLLGAGIAGYLAHQTFTHPSTTKGPLPATPSAWLAAYQAAPANHPPGACRTLLTPQLAAAYARPAHDSCTHQLTHTSRTQLHIRHILQDGDTAVLELHQTHGRLDWTVILNRTSQGWRAVDIIPPRPLP